jgi:hypothetical protein
LAAISTKAMRAIVDRAMKSGTSRALVDGEVALARSVFGNTIDYTRVQVHLRKAYFFQSRRYTMAPDGHLYFHPQAAHYMDDFSAGELAAQAHFIHEMTHVWQHQRGVNVRWAALDRRYRYRLTPGKPLRSYGLEQQAQIVMHAFIRRHQASFAAGSVFGSVPGSVPTS